MAHDNLSNLLQPFYFPFCDCSSSRAVGNCGLCNSVDIWVESMKDSELFLVCGVAIGAPHVGSFVGLTLSVVAIAFAVFLHFWREK